MTEYKSFPFKIDRVDDSGEFCGYASIFGNVDLGGDVVHPGSFKKTLRENKGRVPILDHHDPRKHIGWNLMAREDPRGLFVCGQLNLDVQLARERHSLMKQATRIGGRTGLSIGFRTVREETDRTRPEVRHLKEVQLVEYSIVSFPMNPAAAVTRIKAKHDLVRYFFTTEIGMDPTRAGEALRVLAPFLDQVPGGEDDSTNYGGADWPDIPAAAVSGTATASALIAKLNRMIKEIKTHN